MIKLTSNAAFDRVLNTVSTYRVPQGMDQGAYCLKPGILFLSSFSSSSSFFFSFTSFSFYSFSSFYSSLLVFVSSVSYVILLSVNQFLLVFQKKEYWSEWDPYFMHYDTADQQEAEESYLNHCKSIGKSRLPIPPFPSLPPLFAGTNNKKNRIKKESEKKERKKEWKE